MTPQAQQEPALLSIGETVRYLRTSRTTLYRLAAEGRLSPVKLRRRSLYRKADLDAFTASLAQRAAA